MFENIYCFIYMKKYFLLFFDFVLLFYLSLLQVLEIVHINTHNEKEINC